MLIGGNPPNYYNSNNGFVPAGYLNSGLGSTTVTIGEPAIEFGFNDGANRDVTNFTDTQLVFTDLSFSGCCAGSAGITYTFTDSSFTSLSLVSTDFAGFSYSLNANTITFSFPTFSTTGNTTKTAIFNVGTAPEPGSIALVALGIAALALVKRLC
jgi:hypothetical protein